jgi:hypothetical protein
VTFCARNELAPLVLAPSEQVDEAAALLIAEACNERGERVSVHRLLAFSATWSATSRVARRNLFVFNGCNGRRSGLQPGGCRFDPGRLHLRQSIRSIYVIYVLLCGFASG